MRHLTSFAIKIRSNFFMNSTHFNKLTDLILADQKCAVYHLPSTHCPPARLPPQPPRTSSSSSGGCDGATGGRCRGLYPRSRRGAGWCLERASDYVRGVSYDYGGHGCHETSGAA